MRGRTVAGIMRAYLRRSSRDGAEETVTARGDVLIAADGIHSTVRRIFCPDAGVLYDDWRNASKQER